MLLSLIFAANASADLASQNENVQDNVLAASGRAESPQSYSALETLFQQGSSVMPHAVKGTFSLRCYDADKPTLETNGVMMGYHYAYQNIGLMLQGFYPFKVLYDNGDGPADAFDVITPHLQTELDKVKAFANMFAYNLARKGEGSLLMKNEFGFGSSIRVRKSSGLLIMSYTNEQLQHTSPDTFCYSFKKVQ